MQISRMQRKTPDIYSTHLKYFYVDDDAQELSLEQLTRLPIESSKKTDSCRLDFDGLIEYFGYKHYHELDDTDPVIRQSGCHKFGTDIQPRMVKSKLCIYALRLLIMFGDWLIEIDDFCVFTNMIKDFIENPLVSWEHGNTVYFAFDDDNDRILATDRLIAYYRATKLSRWPESARIFKSTPFGRLPR
nr:unnamed protein product [Callosobruchus chinensis]